MATAEERRARLAAIAEQSDRPHPMTEPRVLLRRDNVQSIPSGGTHDIQWEYAEDEYPAALWDRDARTIVSIQDWGLYRLGAGETHSNLGTGNATGFRQALIYVNGSFVKTDGRPASAAFTPTPDVNADRVLGPGDEVTFRAFQNGGAARDLLSAEAYVIRSAHVPYIRRIAVLGDSISEGEDFNFGYVPALRAEMPTTHVIAAGNSGETTALMEARVPGEVVAWRPDACVVLGGSNDLNTAQSVAWSDQNLNDIYALLDAAAIPVVAVTVPPAAGMLDATEEGRRVALNSVIRAYPRKLVDADLLLRDPANQASLLPAFAQADNIHPNAEGNAVLAAAIAQATEEVLA